MLQPRWHVPANSLLNVSKRSVPYSHQRWQVVSLAFGTSQILTTDFNSTAHMKSLVLFFIPAICLLCVLNSGCNTAPPSTGVDPKTVEKSDSSNASNDPQESKTESDSAKAKTQSASTEGTSSYKILSWNIESDGADAGVICEQLKELNKDDKYDVVALTEVLPVDLSKHRLALGEHYKYIFSKTGFNDRMQILYNESKFSMIRQVDLNKINISKRYRAPMLVHLKDRDTKTQFMVMVNHLARKKAEVRQEQASMLKEWGRDQSLPIIAVGDYNFDYEFETEKGNPAFNNFMQDNIWRWVKPTEFVDTNWYDDPESPDGKDDYPGSMLDFAFVAGPAKDWDATCNVIVREGDFPDDEKTSDHRPFELLISK